MRATTLVSSSHSTQRPARLGLATLLGLIAFGVVGIVTSSGHADEPKEPAKEPVAEPTSDSPKKKLEEKRVEETPALASPEAVVLMGTEKKAADDIKGGGFMDTRLTWTFGDDDVLHRTGATQPLSPLPSIGERSAYRLFFDNLNSRFTGRENLTHLVMYRKMPGFIKNLETEAALVLRFDIQALAAGNNNVNQALYDSGSYLRLFYRTGAPKEGLGLTFFPLDTDRFRLGYLYDMSWGGTNPSRNESIFPRIQGSSPGLKIQYDGSDGLYIYGGFKTASIVQPQTNLRPGANGVGGDVEVVRVAETNYGFLGGFGTDLGKLLHLDVGGGYFQQGRFEFPDLRPLPGEDRQAPRVFTYGTSGRLVFHKDMPTPQSIDFLLYKNDPNAPMMLFKNEKYKADELAYSVSFELSHLRQNLHSSDPGVTGATKVQGATAAAISGIIKAGYARIALAAIYRDLPFILRNVPSFEPFAALPPSARTQSEAFFAASVDYYIESLRLRPGIGGGLQLPATFSSDTDVGNAESSRTVVVRSAGSVSILPVNEKRKPIIQARASLRWDLSDMMATILWVQIVNDPVGTLVTRDSVEGTVGIRTFQSPTFFGFGATLQARY